MSRLLSLLIGGAILGVGGAWYLTHDRWSDQPALSENQDEVATPERTETLTQVVAATPPMLSLEDLAKERLAHEGVAEVAGFTAQILAPVRDVNQGIGIFSTLVQSRGSEWCGKTQALVTQVQ